MDIMPGMGSGKLHALQNFFFAETPLYSGLLLLLSATFKRPYA
jgi:hypothetical protein